MGWVEVAGATEMEEGQAIKLCHAGRVVAVFLAEGEFYAIDDRCTHAEASLAEGDVFETEVECPLHGAIFDLATGEALTLPASRPVNTYATRVEQGKVRVEIPGGQPGGV